MGGGLLGDNFIGRSSDAISAATDRLAQWVGDRLGINARNETFVDVQISNLLTAGDADSSARRNCIRGSGGNLLSYSDAYKAFQRDYKKTYSKRFLTSLGYAPTTTATTRVLDPVAVLAYVQTIDALAEEIESMFIKFISAEEAAYDWMEDNIGWSNQNRTIDIGDGKTWIGLVISDDSTDIQMDFTRSCEEAIVENLTDNYSYNSGNDTVTLQTGPNTYEVTGTTGASCTHLRLAIDEEDFYDSDIEELTDYAIDTPNREPGVYHIKVYETVDTESLVDEYDIEVVGADELYDVPTFDCTDLGGYYRTTVVLQVDPFTEVDIDTTIETLNYNISNDVLDDEKMFVKYNRNTSEWYYYIENLSTIPSSLYTEIDIDMTAIIPLKENNVIIDGGFKQERMLKKLNIDAGLFTASLANDDIDNAYVITGLPANTQTTGGKKAIFNMFDLMLPGSGDVSISMSKLSMTYSFTMTKSTVDELIMDVGSYSNELSSTSEVIDELTYYYYTRTLKYQATETQYKQIVVTNFLQTYVISGETIEATFGDGPEVCRLLIPITILKGLRYRDWVEVYEESLSMLAYATEVVHFEWHQSSNFGVVMQIIAIVVMIVAVIFAIPSGGQTLYWGSVFWTFAINLATNMAIGLAIGYAAKSLIDYLVDELGMDPMLAAAAVAIVVVIASRGMALEGLMAQEAWLTTAVRAGSIGADAGTEKNEEMLSELSDKEDAQLKEFIDDNSDITELIQGLKGYAGYVGINDMNIKDEQSAASEAESFYFMATGGNMTNFNAMLQDGIDPAIRKRISCENNVA